MLMAILATIMVASALVTLCSIPFQSPFPNIINKADVLCGLGAVTFIAASAGALIAAIWSHV